MWVLTRPSQHKDIVMYDDDFDPYAGHYDTFNGLEDQHLDGMYEM